MRAMPRLSRSVTKTIASRIGLLAAIGFAPSPARSAAPPDSSILTIADAKEPGTRMIVTGRMLDVGGKTPAAGLRVGVYHTDATGEYGVHATRQSFPPRRDTRLSGWLVTDAQGRFEIRTIRPGLYPGGSTPAHMHFVTARGGYPCNYEMRFLDDPTLEKPQWRAQRPGTTMQMRPVTKDAKGVQHVTIEWVLY
jgi:protocatechuate 3,4-dioxygenase beta subunit